jgi:hypothetical protein
MMAPASSHRMRGAPTFPVEHRLLNIVTEASLWRQAAKAVI